MFRYIYILQHARTYLGYMLNEREQLWSHLLEQHASAEMSVRLSVHTYASGALDAMQMAKREKHTCNSEPPSIAIRRRRHANPVIEVKRWWRQPAVVAAANEPQPKWSKCSQAPNVAFVVQQQQLLQQQ